MSAGMDSRELIAALAAAVPFNRHLALEYGDVVPGSAEVRLLDRQEHRNHVGTLHAGALFSAAEAASGAAFVAAFAEHLADAVPVVESAEIRYLAPARGTVTARATLTAPLERLLEELGRDGKTRPPVEVRLTDEGGREVATMKVLWNVRKKRPS
jgi:acyl-coenzyme A thioesterase PaaI-like protein